MFCVSIGFVHKGVPVIGVINAPFLGQLFSSCRGRGAWLNETQQLPLLRNPVPPMPAKAPSGCVFSCEWGKDRKDVPDGNMYRKIHGVRSLGSATLDLAYIAMGSFDIWWEGGCWEWYVFPCTYEAQCD
jgi:myo-inositol-1(or 4)-monophosphatase